MKKGKSFHTFHTKQTISQKNASLCEALLRKEALDRSYSTVTAFAKFRGLSTSQPRSSAA